ncbi:MAG TPA: hypothetical protein PLZ94_05450 [Armatimonadota bacterium]|nr:hypothetical protein [Armatimonadota bacterium]
MASKLTRCLALAGIPLAFQAAGSAFAATKEIGNGFADHGVATPISNHRGIVATVDGEGRNVVLLWLYDHRGGYALLMIDAETGRSKEFPIPFPTGGDGPFASILSSANKFYTHFGSHFIEFDPVKGEFTFYHKTVPQMAMGMTEDDNGVIWSVTYPNSGVASYNPKTGEFKDYGHVYQQNWRQYQRSVAADDQGWIYFAVGNTRSQIIALDPKTGQATPLVPESERAQGTAYVYRDLDGKVYGQVLAGRDQPWLELYGGKARPIGKLEAQRKKTIITGSQGLFHRDFPDGSRIAQCDTVERILTIEDPEKKQKTVRFDYQSEGAHIMGVAVAPDGTICGGTAFPMRFFSFDPKTDKWVNRPAYGQWNTVARQGDRFFVGGYTAGFLLEWDPAKPWVNTEKGKAECNPRFLTECPPTINRPHELLATPDGKWVFLAGTPGYGYTGGGLLLWNRETGTRTLLEHTDLIPDHSTMSLALLPDGKLLGGTTISPGTGGEQKAKEAELYILDPTTCKVEWHAVVFPGVASYTDLAPGPRGLIYGVADQKRFFVFDPKERKVVHEQDLTAEFGQTISHQGPRVFVPAPDGTLYMLFVKGIAKVDPQTHAIQMVAESPVRIAAGGDIVDGRLYFAYGSHVYSFKLP